MSSGEADRIPEIGRDIANTVGEVRVVVTEPCEVVDAVVEDVAQLDVGIVGSRRVFLDAGVSSCDRNDRSVYLGPRVRAAEICEDEPNGRIPPPRRRVQQRSSVERCVDETGELRCVDVRMVGVRPLYMASDEPVLVGAVDRG